MGSALSFGASVRPPVPLAVRGTLEIEPGEVARGLKTTVTGDQAELRLTLPLEVKLGARFAASGSLGLNFDLVYQGWSSIQEILLTPQRRAISA